MSETNSASETKSAASGWLNVAVDYGPLLVFLAVYRFNAPAEFRSKRGHHRIILAFGHAIAKPGRIRNIDRDICWITLSDNVGNGLPQITVIPSD
ncbi:MAG: hypothetical protein AAFY42_12035 [Pseudomonadota bacterium]